MTAREITSFEVVEGDSAAVVQAHGELDASSVGIFRAALDTAVRAGQPLVVVDLARVSFLDSAGLAVILGARRQLEVNHRLVLGNVPRRMLKTLRLASVTSLLEVFPEGEAQPWRAQLGSRM